MDDAHRAELQKFFAQIEDPVVRGFIENTTTSPQLDIDPWSSSASALMDHLRRLAADALTPGDLAPIVSSWYALTWLLKQLVQQRDKSHFPGFAEQMCTTWWDSMTAAQIRLRCTQGQSYRAMAPYILAQLAVEQGDRGMALRWAALGHLADALQGRKRGGGNDVTLRFGLGVPDETLTLLDSIAAGVTSATPLTESLPEWLLAEAFCDQRAIPLISPSVRTRITRRGLSWPTPSRMHSTTRARAVTRRGSDLNGL